MNNSTAKPIDAELPMLGDSKPWYAGVTGYQWLVLLIASAGWIFDAYENQIYGVTRNAMLGDLLHQPMDSGMVKAYGDRILGPFLIGGALGGVLFGYLADRVGRNVSMVLSILVYAIFSALTAAVHTIPQVVILRFLVAMGTGGEWAVAASLVAEVFPPRARAQASGIFHATSVFGVAAASGVGTLAHGSWRIAYLYGLIPALLVVAIRFCIREPEKWQHAHAEVESSPGHKQRNLALFWENARYRNRAILGLLLAAVGLSTYWGVFIAGQDLARAMLIRHGFTSTAAAPKVNFAYGVVQNIGMAVGLFAMGPLCATIGRKWAFAVAQIAALIVVPLTCFLPTTYNQLLVMLPLFGLCVGGMHAGYAVYLPELFPTRIRATGAGLCFNGARLLSAPMLWLSGSLKASHPNDLGKPITLFSMVFLLGLVVIFFMPETKGKPLEE